MAPSNYKTADWNSYAQLGTDTSPNRVYTSSGAAGSGKSAMLLTAPEPIWVAAFDTHGLNRVGKQFKTRPNGTPKDIRVSRYHFNPRPYKTASECAKAATVVWDKFVEDYRVALKNARSIGWDREDIGYEILRYANWGDLQAQAKDYGPLNQELTSLVQEAFMAGVNLGLLRGVKEKWDSVYDQAKGKRVGVATGIMIPDGCKKAPDVVDVTLFHRWDEKEKCFMTRIDKFPNVDYKGQEFPNMDFVTMATAAYPDSELESWQ